MKKYHFVIWEKTYSIHDEKDLEVLLKLFYAKTSISGIIHWNILMELDSDLEKIVVSYKWLLLCLKYLNEKNSFLLLIKLGDVLNSLIKNSQELAEILSRIPDESNKIRLLHILRLKGLSKIIFDAKDLGNIFEWLYGKSQRDFIDLLGKDYVKEIFLSTNEIIMILHYLNDENKDYLMDIIGMGGIKNKIKTSQNFLVMLKWLTLKKSRELFKKYTPSEILELFKTQEEWEYFMLRLPSNKEKILLNFLQK